MIEEPQSFIVKEECAKAAFQNGFRRVLGEQMGWAAFGSTTADGTIHLAAKSYQGPWFVALDRSDVIAELGIDIVDVTGPGRYRLVYDDLPSFYDALSRIYELMASLPDVPLREFEIQTDGLPRTTEVERQTIQRIGQNVFRDGLLAYWRGRCPLTGITDPALLKASHIVPWKDCKSDAERLDVHNGILLSALWDAAFDRGLVTFDDAGKPKFSAALSEKARRELRWENPISLTDKHREQLRFHRVQCFQNSNI